MKNALEQTREQARGMLEVVDKLSEEEVIEHYSNHDSSGHGEAIIDIMLEKTSTPQDEREVDRNRQDAQPRHVGSTLCKDVMRSRGEDGRL